MGNITHLLNQTVTVKRKGITQVSKSGEVIDAYETVATNVKIRITKGTQYDGSVKEMGWQGTAQFIAFTEHDADIEENDFLLVDDGKEYLVMRTYPKPGGVSGHHKEIGLNLKKYEDA